MKEQDAAHSFEEWTYEKDIHGTAYAFYRNNDFEFKAAITNPESLASQLNELTRLRSELRQKDEEIVRLLDQIEYQNKTAKEGHDMIKKLEFQISNFDSEFNLPSAAVFNLQQIALADDDMVKTPGAAEQYRFIARHILELFQKSKAK